MKAMLGLFVFLFVPFAAVTDVATAQQAASPAKSLSATYVSAADIQANLNGAPSAATNPQPNIRVVDAGGYNVAVGVLHRPQTPPGVAAVHSKVTEIYHVTDGAGTLVTGGRWSMRSRDRLTPFRSGWKMAPAQAAPLFRAA